MVILASNSQQQQELEQGRLAPFPELATFLKKLRRMEGEAS